MAAHRPEECDLQIAICINAGDLEGAVALYEPGARFVVGPDKTVEGSDGIREVMRSMLADKPRLMIEVPKVVESGDLALLCSKWSSTVTGADGKQSTDTGNGREVVRRQVDGTWRFVIDYPNGGD
ncbi:MAG: SgcJ/EcaC family oxidoreductase [Chloroflexota bacterium]|nr:SgcJ/EcaC family oxidoreductase [Chloroflexota bacterium]